MVVTSIASLLPPLLLVLGRRWANSIALGVVAGACLLRLLHMQCGSFSKSIDIMVSWSSSLSRFC